MIPEEDHLVSPSQREVQAGASVKAHVVDPHKKGTAEGSVAVTDQKGEVVAEGSVVVTEQKEEVV